MAGGGLRRIWTVTGTVVALTAAALAINTYLVDRQVREGAPRDGGTLVDTGGIDVNVKVEGDGPPIVLIHGFSAALDWWDEIAPELAVHHKVIRLDLIGHGGTDAPGSGYRIERQAGLVAAVMDKLGAGKAIVVGHSMGGIVAVALAAKRPDLVGRMILIDSPVEKSVEFNFWSSAYLVPIIGEALSHFRTDDALRQGLSQGFAPGFPVPDRFIADARQLTYTAFRSSHDHSEAYEAEKTSYARLAALPTLPPLLVIFGTEDQLVPVATAKLFETLPGAKVVYVEGAGHSPMVEKPDQVLAAIKEFLGPAP